MFTAIVLDESSKAACVAEAKARGLLWEGWKVFCHHVPLYMGKHPCPELIGQKRTIVVTHYGTIAGRVAAFRVAFASDSQNKTPHITIATNSSVGAKPFESNRIESWVKIPEFSLSGIVEEC